MTRFTKSANGSYMVNGHSYEMLTGSRAQVWHGTACKTSGGLKKSDLMQNKAGRIVSKAKHHTAKKDNRLVKAGYGTKKGTFGFVKLGQSKSSSRRKSKKGGDASGRLPPLNPANYSGKGVGGKRRKMGGTMRRGGTTSKAQHGGMSALNPSPFNGKGVGTSGVNLQFVAGNGN